MQHNLQEMKRRAPDARETRITAALSGPLLPDLVRLVVVYDRVDLQRWRTRWPNDCRPNGEAVILSGDHQKSDDNGGSNDGGNNFEVTAGRFGWFGAVADRFDVGRHKWSVRLPPGVCAIVGIALHDGPVSMTEAMERVAYVSVDERGAVDVETGVTLRDARRTVPMVAAFARDVFGVLPDWFVLAFEVDVDGGRLFVTIDGVHFVDPIVSGLGRLDAYAPFAAIGCFSFMLSGGLFLSPTTRRSSVVRIDE